MRELPGDVFVSGQIDLMTMTALAEQGVMSFINNRPDNEAHMQPSSKSLAEAAKELGVDYRHIPMSGGIPAATMEATLDAFANMPRPIVAFCASGTRSSVLWCVAHVDALGVDTVLAAVTEAGYPLEQIRVMLSEFAARQSGNA